MKDGDMTAEELLKSCEEKIRWIDWKLLLDSYRSEFAEIRCKVFEDICTDKDEIDCFIEICDNRLDHAKTFLGQVTTGLGMIIGAVVIVGGFLISFGTNGGSPNPLSGWWIFIALVLILVVNLLLYVLHYRTEVHAWYVFKEGALLLRGEKRQER